VGPLVAIWNMFNDILSPGTVALPLYIMQSGLYSGAVLLVVFAYLTAYTLEDIYILHKKFEKNNYPDLCDFVLGKWGYWLICLAIFCFNFGGLCAQLMLFGSVVPDIMIDLFGPHAFFTKTNLILCGCVIFVPISFLKDIAKYSFTSFLSVLCVVVIAFLVLFRLIDKKEGDYTVPTSSEHPYDIIHVSFLEALGGLAYIYVCHDLSFNIIGSLKDSSLGTYRKVVGVTMAGTVGACALMGISGYLLFFQNVQANILDSFPTKDTVATVGRIFSAVGVTLCIPFTGFMPRISILMALSALGKKPRKFADSKLGYSIVTLFVMGLAVTIAIVVNNLGKTFELVGGVSACSIAFIFPPILVMKQLGLKNLTPFRRVMTVLTLVSGVIIMVGSTLDLFDYYLFHLWHDVRQHT